MSHIAEPQLFCPILIIVLDLDHITVLDQNRIRFRI
jgi:hypothetical protein